MKLRLFGICLFLGLLATPACQSSCSDTQTDVKTDAGSSETPSGSKTPAKPVSRVPDPMPPSVSNEMLGHPDSLLWEEMRALRDITSDEVERDITIENADEQLKLLEREINAEAR